MTIEKVRSKLRRVGPKLLEDLISRLRLKRGAVTEVKTVRVAEKGLEASAVVRIVRRRESSVGLERKNWTTITSMSLKLVKQQLRMHLNISLVQVIVLYK